MVHRKHIDLEELKTYNQKGLTVTELSKHFDVSDDSIRNRLKELNLTPNRKFLKCSEETKRIISEKRKEWLKNNPDKHPWRNKDKFQSKPCENVKLFLASQQINFISEFDPQIPGRFFSIDLALPDKMIAIEINGNQHYEKDGSLKPYYQERHDLLESFGWKVFEIHYSHCFNLDKWINFIIDLKTSIIKQPFDYFGYTKIETKLPILKVKRIKKVKEPKNKKEKQPKIYLCCDCGQPKKARESKRCPDCHSLTTRKVARPSREELENLLKEHSFVSVGKMFGVSDNAVRKWLKFYRNGTGEGS